MANKEVLWDMDPHTLGKHLVLRSYLDAWIPILGTHNDRLVIIDGFAGPGEYSTGEQGSPVIAMQALHGHRTEGRCNSEVVFYFIEADAKRAEHLSDLLDTKFAALKGEFSTEVVTGEFGSSMTKVLDQIDQKNQSLAPSFVMIDPFGVSGVPMDVIGRILGHKKCEVYVSFMYESINRHKKSKEFEKHLDTLFGCSEWKNSLDIENSDERKLFLYDLYEQQLRESGARYVIRFELYNGNRLKYAIFFATQHEKGSDVMKQAIWKIVPDGQFKYIGKNSGELYFDTSEPNCTPLMDQLSTHYQGDGHIAIEHILSYVMSDQTDFHSGQVKQKTLRPMEIAGRISVLDGTRNRKNTYPKGSKIKFL